MSHPYTVRLEKESLVFSAAHFITFNSNICERLHGHNYRVFVEVTQQVDENQYVVDFIALRDTMQELVLRLDHHMLLPTQHEAIHVEQQGEEIEVRFENRRWVFPLEDCVLLPVINTTAEMLARYLGEQLLEILAEKTGFVPLKTRVGVDECFGQWGIWEK